MSDSLDLWRLPDRLQAWYRVCGSRELARGQVLRWDLPGRSFAVWRGRESGRVHAVAAHCAHMGTHLAYGDVRGDALRCPLHHWEWGGDGSCGIPGVRQRAFPVAEVQGSVFLFNGPVPRYPPPHIGSEDGAGLVTLAGRPVRLRCHWIAVACNGFDMQHMQTVHGRALRSEPGLQRLDAWRLRMRLESRVTGQGLEDRVVQWLARDHVRLTVTCSGGTAVAVESDLGRVRSALLLCLRPVMETGEGVEVTPVFAVPRGPLAGLRVRAARALFSGFIRKDVAFMDDMQFHPGTAGPADPVLYAFLQYLRELPVDEDAPGERADNPAADSPPLTRRGGFA